VKSIEFVMKNNLEKILVIIGDDKSNIRVSENIIKYLNSINKNNEYHFFISDNSKNLKKLIKKNIIKKNFIELEKNLKVNEYDWLINIWSSVIFKREFLSKFNNNLNLHPSYLPYNKGKDPYCWSIFNETPIGVSIHEMNEKIDAGKIYLRKKILVLFPYSAYQIYNRSLEEIKDLFIKNWLKIKAKKIKARSINIKTPLNLRKHYYKHNFIDLNKKTRENKIIKKFILNILSCDFNRINSLQIKLKNRIFDTKISLKKKNKRYF